MNDRDELEGELPGWLADLATSLRASEPDHRDPLHDVQRLRAVGDLDVDGAEGVQALVGDLLTAAAGDIGVPVSLLNVVLTDTALLAGAHGIDGGWLEEARAVPAEWAPCSTVVRTRVPHVIPDMAVDAVASTSPLCTVDGMRSYAGVPLVTRQGQAIGTVCVLDTRPRDFDEGHLAVLHAVAAQAVQRLEERARRGRDRTNP